MFWLVNCFLELPPVIEKTQSPVDIDNPVGSAVAADAAGDGPPTVGDEIGFSSLAIWSMGKVSVKELSLLPSP